MLNIGILLWMVVAETEVFEFGLDFVQAQSVGERCINIQGCLLYTSMIGILKDMTKSYETGECLNGEE